MSEWNLTPEQTDFLVRPIEPYDETDPTSVPDFMRQFTGPKKGLAPWSKAYDCANNGFKVNNDINVQQ